MNAAVRSLIFAAVMLGGCQTAHDVAVTSYRVATAPVRYVRDRFDNSASTTTTTTTTTVSDVTTPGEPVPPPVTASDRGDGLTRQRSHTSASSGGVRKPTTAKSKAPTPPSSAASQSEFPTAKPVSGKPGYVYSPSDPGKYVDVSGYAAGSKVKDPYSGKIFLVP